MIRPRVAHVIGARGLAGAERVVAALIAGGQYRGWDQLVLNPFATPSSEAFAVRCTDARYEARSCSRIMQLGALRRWLDTSLEEFQPDIVHAHLYHAAVAVATLPRRAGERRVLTHHHGEWLPAGIRAPLRRAIDTWAGRRYDRIVAVSQSVRRHLVDERRYPASMIVHIPNGWEGEPGERSPGGPAVPTVVCVGGFRPEKGHATLVSAFASVRRQLPDARLVLVGDGELRPALVEQVNRAGLEGSVEFVGAVDNAWSYLRDADVFALASRYETFGMVVVEAMAAGLPVVAPPVGGIPELVTPGQNGELFPPGDADALAAQILRLLRSPELRTRMGVAARQSAQAFRMETTVQRYFELYEGLLGTPAPTGIRRRHWNVADDRSLGRTTN